MVLGRVSGLRRLSEPFPFPMAIRSLLATRLAPWYALYQPFQRDPTIVYQGAIERGGAQQSPDQRAGGY